MDGSNDIKLLNNKFSRMLRWSLRIFLATLAIFLGVLADNHFNASAEDAYYIIALSPGCNATGFKAVVKLTPYGGTETTTKILPEEDANEFHIPEKGPKDMMTISFENSNENTVSFNIVKSGNIVGNETYQCNIEDILNLGDAKIILPAWPDQITYGTKIGDYYYYHVYGDVPESVHLKDGDTTIHLRDTNYYNPQKHALRLPNAPDLGYIALYGGQGESSEGSYNMCVNNTSATQISNPKYSSSKDNPVSSNSINLFCADQRVRIGGTGGLKMHMFDSLTFRPNGYQSDFYAPRAVYISVDNFLNCGSKNSIAAENCKLYRRTHLGDFEIDKVYDGSGNFVGWGDYSYHDESSTYCVKYADDSIRAYTGSGDNINEIIDGGTFEVSTPFTTSGAQTYRLPIAACKPKLNFKDFDGNDVSIDNKFESGYDVTFNPRLTYRSHNPTGQKYFYIVDHECLKIKNKADSIYKPLNRDDFMGDNVVDYDKNTGAIELSNYTVRNDLTIQIDAFCTSALYVGSKTNAEPWKNESLRNGYSLAVEPSDKAKSRNSNNDSRGAWRCSVYDKNVTSVDFNMESKLGYEFLDLGESGTNVTAENATVSNEHISSKTEEGNVNPNKILTFTSTVPQNQESKIMVAGQKYTEYTNTFKYNDSAALKDISTMTCGSSDSSVAISEVENNYRQTWTIASPGNFNKYKVVAKPGYALSSETKVKIGDSSPVAYSDDFEVSKAGRANKNLDITIGPLKWVYQVTFNAASESMKGDIEIKHGEDVISWNTESDPYQLDEDDSFTVVLNITNSRKKFVDNVESIAFGEGIKECKRNSDTSITLTIIHGVSEVNIPEAVYEWRKSSVSFVLNTGEIEDDYYTESVNALKLYRGDSTSTTAIDLVPSGADKIVVSREPDKNVPYNQIKYTLKLDENGGSYVSLQDVVVSIEAQDVKEDEVKVQERSPASVTFYLDSAHAEAFYRGEVKFHIDSIKSSLKQIPFSICSKSLLYKQVGSEKDPIAKAPNNAPWDGQVGIPGSGKTTFIVFYPDYSRIFNKDNVKCIDTGAEPPTPITQGVTIEDAEFNQVKITINSNEFPDNAKIICTDPARPAPPVTFNPIEGIKYYNVDAEKNIDLNSSIQGVLSIPYREEFSFAVKNNEGYDLSSLKINKNGAEMRKIEKDGYCVFTISNDDAIVPMTITGSISPVQCKITFKDSSEFSGCKYFYNGSETRSVTVLYGQGISFEVSLPGNCNQSDLRVRFSKESDPLNKIEGKYVINNITGDGEVTLENLKLNKYPVTFSSNDRAYYKTWDDKNLSGTINVEHGQNYTFKVKANAGYRLGEDTVVYLRYANGSQTTLDPDSNGNYKINNIQQACTVSVENVDDLIYTVKLEPVLGVTYLNEVDNVIKDSVQVRYGRNFEFSVVLEDTYDDSYAGMNIMVNGGKSAKSSAQKLASGRYVIPNVTEDMTIKVGNIKKNCYTVTLMGQEGIDYYNSSGKIITGDNQIEHHSDFEFKVELYPAYAGSNITVMLGDTPMTADSNGYYKIPKVSESKTVTVVGVEQSDETELVNKINNLPGNLDNLGDVDDVIAATKMYEALPDSAKAMVGNIDKLRALQEQVKAFHHVSNDVKIEGVDWNIKLYAIPITDDVEACRRIYKKLNSEYILSLYNVYLWDTLTDTRYTLPEGKTAVITLPTPDMKYFEKPTAIHERSSGKVEFINLSINGNLSIFQTDSFSPMGIVANRSSTPGRSSLLDAADANADAISRFAAEAFGNSGGTISRSSDSGSDAGISGSANDGNIDSDNMSGNIDEKFRSRNNKVNAMSSALRLILVIMVLALIGTIVYLLIKKKRDNKDKNESKNN